MYFDQYPMLPCITTFTYLTRRPIPKRRITQQSSHIPLLRRPKRLQHIGIPLDRVPSLSNTVIHDYQSATTFCSRVDGYSDGFEEVRGTVSGGRGGGAHGPDDDDGFGAGEGYVQRECLKGISRGFGERDLGIGERRDGFQG